MLDHKKDEIGDGSRRFVVASSGRASMWRVRWSASSIHFKIGNENYQTRHQSNHRNFLFKLASQSASVGKQYRRPATATMGIMQLPIDNALFHRLARCYMWMERQLTFRFCLVLCLFFCARFSLSLRRFLWIHEWDKPKMLHACNKKDFDFVSFSLARAVSALHRDSIKSVAIIDWLTQKKEEIKNFPRSQLKIHRPTPSQLMIRNLLSPQSANSPHGLHGNGLEDVLSTANADAEAAVRIKVRI